MATKHGYRLTVSEILATHTNSAPADFFFPPLSSWKIWHSCEKRAGHIFFRRTWATKLYKTRLCGYSFIFQLSRKFGTIHILSFYFMELVPGSYDHFQNWFGNAKNQRYNSRATSSWKDGRVLLKCNCCPVETPISPNGAYWNIENFTKHLKHSTGCTSIGDMNNTTSMVASDSLTVS